MSNSQPMIEAALGYIFKDKALLTLALTHRSGAAVHNERLEFLGDSILGMVIAHKLYVQFPKAKEGQLSRLKSKLVKGESLAELAELMEIGKHLVLGSSERQSGGFNRASILEDTIEAIIGAVFLDGGFLSAEQVILHLFDHKLQAISLDDAKSDAKSALQELLQHYGQPLPLYDIVKTEGAEHDQVFHVRCQLVELKVETEGVGKNRKLAEQAAAAQALPIATAQLKHPNKEQ